MNEIRESLIKDSFLSETVQQKIRLIKSFAENKAEFVKMYFGGIMLLSIDMKNR
jgi:hypothetical protein